MTDSTSSYYEAVTDQYNLEDWMYTRSRSSSMARGDGAAPSGFCKLGDLEARNERLIKEISIDIWTSRGRSPERASPFDHTRNSSTSSARSKIDYHMYRADEERSRSSSIAVTVPASPWKMESNLNLVFLDNAYNFKYTLDNDVSDIPAKFAVVTRPSSPDATVEQDDGSRNTQWNSSKTYPDTLVDGLTELHIASPSETPPGETYTWAEGSPDAKLDQDDGSRNTRLNSPGHNWRPFDSRVNDRDGIFVDPEVLPNEVRTTSTANPQFGMSCEPSHMTNFDSPASFQQDQANASLADQFNEAAHEETCIPSAPPDRGEYQSQDPSEPQHGSEDPSQDPTNTSQRSTCFFCNRHFGCCATLENLQRYHTGDRPFLCPRPSCTESFTQHNDRETREKAHCCERSVQCGEPLPNNLPWSESMSDTRSPSERLRIPPPVAEVSPSTIARPDQTIMSLANRTSTDAPHAADVSSEAFDGGGSASKSRHTPKQSVTCSLCSKNFARRTILKTHHRRKHTGERPFRCAECGEAFAQDSDKKRHEKIHGGQKSFKCGGTRSDGSHWGCGKAYRRRDGLLEHHNKSVKGGNCVAERDKS